MGWLFVCFDLPVVEKEELRLANRFRKDLLKLGYNMLQNSMYVRSCVTYEKTEQYTKIVSNIAPETGSIQVFYLTDAQWSNSVCIEKINYKTSKYQQKAHENGERQMAFW
ncbi:CRISPR-associated endonuclease Cas2 [Candidatus Termititenax aidoneus]|uniref:CRISPR-associated endoribonuclease Cas2 n=1 Tax=Termititenax aidoneus TaxID=2218524 RepID=A0A388T8P9_TERA1|nr:CRISPR-associated endonuclease Cas2 [Candidatus Termititenax aidoneus]